MATENKEELLEMAEKILELASQKGVEKNFFFITTFKRYRVQLDILSDLEETIKEEGNTVTKEYVKGRKNVYTHPAIGEYNKTSTAANQTVTTLIKIITSMTELRGDEEAEEEPDLLLEFIKGHR